MNVPDWLWQGLVENAIWAGIAFSAGWAWKSWRAMQRKPVLLSGRLQGKSALEGTLTVVSKRQTFYAVRTAEESKRRSSYKIESPTPSLARRLEELMSWYLHVS
jgi:hypothetical protein